jgi:hypothetical protein
VVNGLHAPRSCLVVCLTFLRLSLAICDTCGVSKSPNISTSLVLYYVKKTHLRHVRIKNGDGQIAHLHHHISHYRVVEDARLDAFSISIHWRHEKSEHVPNLISSWGHTMTLIRDMPKVSSITKKSETCFILVHRQFNYQLGSPWQ